MRVDARIPIVHIERLRCAAREVGCTGLLAFIELEQRAFYGRKRVGGPASLRGPDVDDSDSELQAALDELCDTLEARYADRELKIASIVDEDDEDCTFFPRFAIYMAETIPTLRPAIRDLIDRHLGEVARARLNA